MDPNEALAEIRELLGEIEATTATDEYIEKTGRLQTVVQGLDEWLSKDGFLPTAWAAGTRLGPNDLHALSEITDACIHGYKVARLIDDDIVIEGVARSIGDENGNFLRRDEDVRNGYLRVSSIFEYFWPVRELMPQVHNATFVIRRGE